jgi:hypothetical protein
MVVLCGANPEVESLGPATSLGPQLSVGGTGDEAKDANDPIALVEDHAENTFVSEGEAAGIELFDNVESGQPEGTFAIPGNQPDLESSMDERIQKYIQARLASPEVVAMIKAETARFNKRNPGALSMHKAKADAPRDPLQAAEQKMEASVEAQLALPSTKRKIDQETKVAVAAEADKIQKRLHLAEETKQSVNVEASQVLGKLKDQADRDMAKASSRLEGSSSALKQVGNQISAEGKAKLQKNLADAKAKVKAAAGEESEVSKLEKEKKALEEAAVEQQLAKDNKDIRKSLQGKMRAEVTERVKVGAEETADSKIKDIAESIDAGVKRAETLKKIAEEKKRMLAAMKIPKVDLDNDKYWTRRRSFRAEKAKLTGELLETPKQEQAEKAQKEKKQEAEAAKKKKEQAKAEEADQAEAEKAVMQAGKQALKDQVAEQMPPNLVATLAASAVGVAEAEELSEEESAVPVEELPKVDLTEEAKADLSLEQAKNSENEQKALAHRLSNRIDAAIDREAELRKEVQDALNLKQAKEARAGIARAELDKSKDKDQLKLTKVRLSAAKATVLEAEQRVEAIKAKKVPVGLKQVAEKVSPQQLVIAADEVVQKMHVQKEEPAAEPPKIEVARENTPDPEPEPEPEPEPKPETQAQKEERLKQAVKDTTKNHQQAVEGEAHEHLKVHDAQMAVSKVLKDVKPAMAGVFSGGAVVP